MNIEQTSSSTLDARRRRIVSVELSTLNLAFLSLIGGNMTLWKRVNISVPAADPEAGYVGATQN